MHGTHRNVGQIRAYLLRAQAEQERERHRNYKLAMYGRSAALLGRNKGFLSNPFHACEDDSDCGDGKHCQSGTRFSVCSESEEGYTQEQLNTPCAVPFPYSSSGSAVLIGDGRLLTALHNVDGHYEPSDHQFDGLEHFTEGTRYFLSFDGAHQRRKRRDGTLTPYDEYGTFVRERTGVYADDEAPEFQVDLVEENPLLANRLFQLGLENWAINNDPDRIGRWARNWLRKDWPASFAQCPIGLNWCDDEDDERGFGTAWTYLDIAVFEAEVYGDFSARIDRSSDADLAEVETFLFGDSGSFLIDRPAVFFNRVPAAPYAEYAPNVGTPAWSAFFQDWLDPKHEDARVVPLVTRDATLGVDEYNAAITDPGHYLWGETQLCDENILRGFQNRKIPSTIDAYTGSSGGGVFACEHVEACGIYDGDGSYRRDEQQIGPINTIGLIKSAEADDPADKERWGTPTGHGITSSSYTGVTPLDELSVEWAEFDDDVVTHPKDDSSRLNCLVEGFLGCLRWEIVRDEEEQEESETGILGESPGIGNVFNPAEPNSMIGNEGRFTTLCGWGNASAQQIEDTNCDCEAFAGACSDGTCIRRDVQAAVGFVGSAIDEGGKLTVADFRPICGPWTGSPYTENWRHLHIEGAAYGFENDTGFPAANRPRLHEALLDMSERRGDQIRPASMKMCPPNYLPDMISVAVTEDGDDRYVTSLDHMRCKRVRAEEKTAELMSVRLYDLDYNQVLDEYELDRFSGYTLAGKAFFLEQRIGYPNHGRINDLPRQIRSCAPGVIRGINTVYDGQGRLRNIGVECMPTPQP